MRLPTKGWIGIFLGLGVLGLIAHALQYSFITDDAYISFRYSYNFATHNQLVFNIGERVEGYTNFLWTVLLGVLLKLGLVPEMMARLLGAFFGAAGLVLVFLLTRLYRGGQPTGWALLAPFILAATAGYAVWCGGGLETQMFSALVLAGSVLYLAEHTGRVRWRLSGFIFALAAMTRPEGVLFFAITVLHRWLANLFGVRRWWPNRAEVSWLAGFLVPLGVFYAWRYSYYGYPFPNTFYVKAGGGATASATKWGIPYLWDFVQENKLYVLLPLVLLFRPRVRWRQEEADTDFQLPSDPGAPGSHNPASRDDVQTDRCSRGIRPLFVWSYLALLVVPFSGYVVLVGGDFMTMGRFFVPTLPFWAFLLQECLRELVERPRRAPQQWRVWRMLATGVLLMGLLSWNSVGLFRENQKLGYHRWGLDTIAYLDRFASDRIIVGTWIRHHLPANTYLAVGGAGAIVYSSRMKALDTFGLNDAWIAHHTPPVGDRPGHTKTAPESYLLAQRPDLMCHQAKHQNWPYRAAPAEDQYWRQRGYTWVCLHPPGLHPAYYCCLKRMDRRLGPFPVEVGW